MPDNLPEQTDVSEQPEKDESAERQPEPADELVITKHTMMIDGAELKYTATAGRMVLRAEGHTDDKFDGAKPKAEVFLTSYVLDREEGATGPSDRPVTFAFNGGPGSSS